MEWAREVLSGADNGLAGVLWTDESTVQLLTNFISRFFSSSFCVPLLSSIIIPFYILHILYTCSYTMSSGDLSIFNHP